MLFNSLSFFAFFPIVVTLHYLTPPRGRWVVLLAASYCFYGAWNPKYLVFLLLSTLVDFCVGILLGKTKSQRRRKLLLAASLCVSFGMLFVFKYLHFFAASAASLFGARVPALDLVLPIGISFYTFQTVSYTIDVYRREREPETHFGYFALFVAFFPHLVAGPIVRAKKLIPQLKQHHPFDYDRAVSGLKWMLWGFFKKVVIADRAAAIVSAVYDKPQHYQAGSVIVATYAFAFQIYCDFSGYSDIAIGAARILGVELTKNFDQPYGAASVVEFWRRWHISLSTWFRDYVYHPLGGARVSWPRRAFNIFVVFLLSGMWHGANWTFFAWGAYHGILMITTLLVAAGYARWFGHVEVRAPFRRLARVLGVVVTFHLVSVGWVFFRAKDLAHAHEVFSRLSAWDDVPVSFELTRIGAAPPSAMALDLFVLLVSIVALEAMTAALRRSLRPRGALGVLAWAALSVWVVLFAVQSHTPFIYFQF